MVVRLAVACVLTTAVVSAAAASPRPLHEIAGPTAATVCGNVVVHANAAIAVTVRNDAALTRALGRLRSTDFDAFSSARKSALGEVGHVALDVADGAERGESETRRLRYYADHPAGADRGTEIRTFAGALDAALEGQRKIASGLGAFLVAFDTRDLREEARLSDDVLMNPGDTDAVRAFGHVPLGSSPATAAFAPAAGSATAAARAQASDLDSDAREVAANEARAEAHSEAAVGGC